MTWEIYIITGGVIYGSVKPNIIGMILSALGGSLVGVTLTLFLVLVHVAHVQAFVLIAALGTAYISRWER